MANIFQNIGKAIADAAEQGEDVAKHVFKQVLEHPEVLALGPIGLGLAAGKNLMGGRSLFGERVPSHRTGSAPPMPGSAYGPGKLSGLLQAALLSGKTIAGTQPYTVTSYYGAASATAVVKNTDIADMFASANCTAFTVADTFPWPYQSYRMRWSYTSVIGILTTTAAATAASVADPAWISTLHAVFSNATEIARVALNSLGLRISLIAAQGNVATAVAATGVVLDTQPGVLWPVYYEKNGSYVMSVRSDHAIGTCFSPYQISMQLDGWVINDPSLLDADGSQIQQTIDSLMRGGGGYGNSVAVPR